LIAVGLCTAFATMAVADRLDLVNGDVLSGTLESVSQGVVVFATEYAGTLSIAIEYVEAVTTDEPVAVRLPDRTVLMGRLCRKDGAQMILMDGASILLSLENMDAVAEDGAALAPIPTSGDSAKEERWSGSVDAGLTLHSGDTDTAHANVGLSLERRWPRHVLSLGVTGGYGEVDSEVDTRRIRGDAKWQYYLTERCYTYARGAAEHDRIHRLESRFEIGGGVGYDFVANERRAFSGDVGLDYAYEEWLRYAPKELEHAKALARSQTRNNVWSFVTALPTRARSMGDVFEGLKRALDALTADVDQETAIEHPVSIRIEGAYKQRVFERSAFSERLALLPNVDAFGEYRLLSDMALETPLSEKLSLQINWKMEYDSHTRGGDDLYTNTLVTGLKYRF